MAYSICDLDTVIGLEITVLRKAPNEKGCERSKYFQHWLYNSIYFFLLHNPTHDLQLFYFISNKDEEKKSKLVGNPKQCDWNVSTIRYTTIVLKTGLFS